MASWDDSFLSEVEDFLTSCDPQVLSDGDGSESATTGPSSSSTADSGDSAPDVHPTGAKGKPKARARRKARFKRQLDDRTRHKAYRERQRTEREKLEAEVEELQSKLVKTRARVLSLSAWSILSKRQLQARSCAETRYRQLRSVVTMQSALIQGYGTLIHEQITNGGDLVHVDRGGGVFDEPNRIELDAFDSEFFQSYFRQLSDVYAQTDAMFSGCAAGTTGKGPSDSWRASREAGFLFRSQQSVLFDFAKTCELLWRVADVPHRRESRQRFNEVEDPENTVAIKFRVTCRQTPGKGASLLQRCIARRYQEQYRTVLVWRVFVEGEGTFAGMHADVVGWGLIVPSTGPSKENAASKLHAVHASAY